MDALTTTLTSPMMESIANIIISVVAPVLIGWLFYLTKRQDTTQDKILESEQRHAATINKIREDHELRSTASEQKHFDRIANMEGRFNDKLLETINKFVDMHNNTATNFVTKTDFNRGLDSLSAQLTRIEAHLQTKVDK